MPSSHDYIPIMRTQTATATATASIRRAYRLTLNLTPQQAQLEFEGAAEAPAVALASNQRHRLQAQNSPIDLMLRGFRQGDILTCTGVDIGYHGCSLRDSAKGVDRFEYKVEHVRVRVDQAVVLAAVAAHAQGVSKIATLRLLGLSGENTVTLRRFFAALGRAEEFAAADRAFRRGNMTAGMLAKHGVANPFVLAEFQEKGVQTRVERYGGKFTFSADSSLAESARASFALHMTDEAFAEDLRSRKAAATRDRYGVDYPSQSPLVQAKTRATFRERYGVDHPSQRQEARTKQAAVARADGKRRSAISRQTNLARYGVEYTSQLPANRARQSKLMIRTHPDRNKKARATTLDKYGVPYVSQRPERRAAHSSFMKINGVEFAARSRMTSLKRYGVDHHAQTDQRRKSQSLRMLDPEHQRRINAAKRANNSFNTSAPEEELYGLLVGYFGKDQVLRQHNDPSYNYRCDFYIPSRDLFIELNGTWTHGGHWFDQDDHRDRQVVERWRAKSAAYYKTAILQWCQRDTARRNAAGAARLNYVTFWDSQHLDDARLWLAMGAPDGSDWKHAYTWLPARELILNGTFPVSNERPCAAATTTGTANWQETYQRELEMWEDNRGTRWGTVQAVLYSDRYRVLGKLPQGLSTLEILEGLSEAACRVGHPQQTHEGRQQGPSL